VGFGRDDLRRLRRLRRGGPADRRQHRVALDIPLLRPDRPRNALSRGAALRRRGGSSPDRRPAGRLDRRHAGAVGRAAADRAGGGPHRNGRVVPLRRPPGARRRHGLSRAGHHRTEVARGGIARRPAPRRGRQPSEIGVPRQHVARVAHAHERGRGHGRHAAREPARRGEPALRLHHQVLRRGAAGNHQSRPRLFQDGGRTPRPASACCTRS